MKDRKVKRCDHCGTLIRFPATMVARSGKTFCCPNCADAEEDAALREQLELELDEPGEQPPA